MSNKNSNYSKITSIQLNFLAILRIAIGWHFLYEGFVKLFDPEWSSASFLAQSKGVFSGIFHWIAVHPTILNFVDFLNIWGLILIGLGLFFGIFTRISSISGALLLLLYYIVIPPFIGYRNALPTEGSYLIVDKTLIELFALCVLAIFPTGRFWGLDRFILMLKSKYREYKINRQDSKPGKQEIGEESKPAVFVDRREIIKSLATLPLFGAFVYALLKKRAWDSYEERHLMAATKDNLDAITSATVKTHIFSSLKDLTGKLPYGQIGSLKVSRLFLGGNLIGGWAHARDLIYVSKLVKSYHTDQKVFDTFRLSESCGINTILTNPQLCRVINEYWRKEKGKIQFISDCGYKDDVMTGIKMSIDGGAHACYVQGAMADRRVQRGNVEEIGEAIEFIRQNGLPAGIGAHCLETVKVCVDFGLQPDFWVKTLHHTNYWSAKLKEQHDNIWCTDPDETIKFMENLEQPWIAFKTLAAGAIHPKVGFPYAFENGADFICVGMYDFQIVDDVNIALEVLSGDFERKRPWRA